MLVEHARNTLGITDATHTEYGGDGASIVNELSCSLVASDIQIEIAAGTQLAGIHGAGLRTELTNCNYGLNPAFDDIADQGGMIVSARDDTGEVRAVELIDHPFFVGTLYQPQRQPASALPHPLFDAFVVAVVAQSSLTT